MIEHEIAIAPDPDQRRAALAKLERPVEALITERFGGITDQHRIGFMLVQVGKLAADIGVYQAIGAQPSALKPGMGRKRRGVEGAGIDIEPQRLQIDNELIPRPARGIGHESHLQCAGLRSPYGRLRAWDRLPAGIEHTADIEKDTLVHKKLC